MDVDGWPGRPCLASQVVVGLVGAQHAYWRVELVFEEPRRSFQRRALVFRRERPWEAGMVGCQVPGEVGGTCPRARRSSTPPSSSSANSVVGRRRSRYDEQERSG
ncbi:hypothetical protein [Haloarchaeobius sp. HRN-SO-5]|uniref:hypothetical protein n=1 Tax=Haloarchaeobius sp. HRN-SO-5 TaxID=3446118 RepID=UPI003EB8090E